MGLEVIRFREGSVEMGSCKSLPQQNYHYGAWYTYLLFSQSYSVTVPFTESAFVASYSAADWCAKIGRVRRQSLHSNVGEARVARRVTSSHNEDVP